MHSPRWCFLSAAVRVSVWHYRTAPCFLLIRAMFCTGAHECDPNPNSLLQMGPWNAVNSFFSRRATPEGLCQGGWLRHLLSQEHFVFFCGSCGRGHGNTAFCLKHELKSSSFHHKRRRNSTLTSCFAICCCDFTPTMLCKVFFHVHPTSCSCCFNQRIPSRSRVRRRRRGWKTRLAPVLGTPFNTGRSPVEEGGKGGRGGRECAKRNTTGVFI